MQQNDLAINWYAIHVRPRCEFLTAIALHNKGFELFVPRYTSKRKWSDRKVELELPLFPGYIFCKFDVRVRMPVLTTPGVMRIVGTSRTPLPLEAAEIEAVQRVVKSGCKVEPHPFIAVGSKVCIENGPLAGLEGMVTNHKNRQLVISISLVQQSISIAVENWAVSVKSPSAEYETAASPIFEYAGRAGRAAQA
jgi:transcription antitermination factor NusG